MNPTGLVSYLSNNIPGAIWVEEDKTAMNVAYQYAAYCGSFMNVAYQYAAYCGSFMNVTYQYAAYCGSFIA